MGFFNRLSDRVKKSRQSGSNLLKDMKSLQNKKEHRSWLNGRALSFESLENRELLSVNPVAVDDEIYTVSESAATTTMATTDSTSAVSVSTSQNGEKVDANTTLEGRGTQMDVLDAALDAVNGGDRQEDTVNYSQEDTVNYSKGGGMLSFHEKNITKYVYANNEAMYAITTTSYMETAAELIWASGWGEQAGFANSDAILTYIKTNFNDAYYGRADEVVNWFFSGDFTEINSRWTQDTSTWVYKNNENGGGLFQEVNVDSVLDHTTMQKESAGDMGAVAVALDAGTAVSIDFTYILQNYSKDGSSGLIDNPSLYAVMGNDNDRSQTLGNNTSRLNDLDGPETEQTHTTSLVVKEVLTAHVSLNVEVTDPNRYVAIKFANNEPNIGIEADVWYLIEYNTSLECYTFAVEPYWYYYSQNSNVDGADTTRANWNALTANTSANIQFCTWNYYHGKLSGAGVYEEAKMYDGCQLQYLFKTAQFNHADTDRTRLVSTGNGFYGYIDGANIHYGYKSNKDDKNAYTTPLILNMAFSGYTYLNNYNSKVAPASVEDTFKLESNKTATNVIYLDFSTMGLDSWSATVSFQEAQYIQEIWQCVAEDFAPFNVNVTTNPALANTGVVNKTINIGESLTKRVQTATRNSQYELINSLDGMKSFIGPSFTENSTTYKTPFGKYGGELASYMAGRSLAQGGDTWWNTASYSGSGLWGPIMGNPSSVTNQYTQWSFGEYIGATDSRKDEIGAIGAILGFRKDEAGDTIETAVRLEDYIVDVDKQYDILTALYSGSGADYEAQQVNGYSSSQAMYVFSGVIGVHESQNTDDGKRVEEYRDYDVFSFTTGDAGGKYVIDVSGIGADLRWNTKDWGYDVDNSDMQSGYYDSYDWWMTNLNIKVEFLLSDGTVLYTFDPLDSSFVHFTTKELDANTTYYLRISGIGEGNPLTNGFSAYGSLGSYALKVAEDLTSKVATGRNNAIVVTSLNDTVSVDNEITLREALSYIGRRLENGQYISSEIVFSSELEGGTIYLNSGNIYDVNNKTEFKTFTDDEEGQKKYDLYLASVKDYGELALNYALANQATTINAQYFWNFETKSQDVSVKDDRYSVTWATGTNITIDARPVELNRDNTWQFNEVSIRVIHVENISAILQGLIITGGVANNGASRYELAADSEDQYGGGIYNDRGWLSVINCTIAGNEALKAGGGIFNTGGYYNIKYPSSTGNEYWRNDFYGKLVVVNSQIVGNVTTFNFNAESGSVGGGLYNDFFGEVWLYNCTISGNASAFSGGGIENYGRLRVSNSIIAENYSSVGVDLFTKVDAFTFGDNVDAFTFGDNNGDDKSRVKSTLVYNSLIGSQSINDDKNSNNYGSKYGKVIDNIAEENNVYGTYDNLQDPGFLIAPDYQKANRDGVYKITDTLNSWNVDLWKEWNLRLRGNSAAQNIGGSGTMAVSDGHANVSINQAVPNLAKTGLTYNLVGGQDLAGYDRVVTLIDAGAFELQVKPDFTDYAPTINTYEDSLMDWKDSIVVSRSQKDRTGIAEGTYDAVDFYANYNKSEHPEIIETAESEDLYISYSFMNVSATSGTNDVVSSLKLQNYGLDGLNITEEKVLFNLHVSNGFAADGSILMLSIDYSDFFTGELRIGTVDGTNNQLAKGSWDYIYCNGEKIGKVTYKDNGMVLIEDLSIGSLSVGFYAVELELDPANIHDELEENNNLSYAMFRIVKAPTVVVNTLEDNRDSYDDKVSLYEAMNYVGSAYSSEFLVDGNEIVVDDITYCVIDGKFYTFEKGYFYEDVDGKRTALTDGNTYYLSDGVVIDVQQQDGSRKIQLNAKNESGRIDAVFNKADGSFTIKTDTLNAASLDALLVTGNTYKISAGTVVLVGENEQSVTLAAKNEDNLIDIIFNGDGTFSFVEDTLDEATIAEIKQYNEESLTLENGRLGSSLLVSLTNQTKIFLTENTMFFASDSQYSTYRYGLKAGTGYSNYVTVRYIEKVFESGTAIKAIYNNYGAAQFPTEILIRYTAGNLVVEETGKFIYDGKTGDYINLNAKGNPGNFKVTVAMNTVVTQFVDSVEVSVTLAADTEMIWYYGDVWVTKAGGVITGYYELSEATSVAINAETGSYITNTKKTTLVLEDGEELTTSDETVIVYRKTDETTGKFYIKDSIDNEEYIPEENENFSAYLTVHESTSTTFDTNLTIKKGDIVSQTIKLGTTVYFSNTIREQLDSYNYKEAYNLVNNNEAISWIDIPVDGITLLQDIVIEGRYFTNEDASIFYDRENRIIYQSGLDSYLKGESEINKNLDYEIYVAYAHDKENIASQDKLFANLDNRAGDGDMKFVYSANNVHFVNGYGNVSLKTETLKKNPDLADWKAPMEITRENENSLIALNNSDNMELRAAFVGDLAVLATEYLGTDIGFTASLTLDYTPKFGEVTTVSSKDLFKITSDTKFSYWGSTLKVTSDYFGTLYVKDTEGNYSILGDVKQGDTLDLYYRTVSGEYVFAAEFAYTYDLYLYDNTGTKLISTQIGTNGTGSYVIMDKVNLGQLDPGAYTCSLNLELDNNINESDPSDADNIYSYDFDVIEASSNVITTLDDVVSEYDGFTSLREALAVQNIGSAVNGNLVTIDGQQYEIVDGKFYQVIRGDYIMDPNSGAFIALEDSWSGYLTDNALVMLAGDQTFSELPSGTQIIYEDGQFYSVNNSYRTSVKLSNNTRIALSTENIASGDYVVYVNNKMAEVSLPKEVSVSNIANVYSNLQYVEQDKFNRVSSGKYLTSDANGGSSFDLESAIGQGIKVRISAADINAKPGSVKKFDKTTGTWENYLPGALENEIDLVWNWGDYWTVTTVGSDNTVTVDYFVLTEGTTVIVLENNGSALAVNESYVYSTSNQTEFTALENGMILTDNETGAQFQYIGADKSFKCLTGDKTFKAKTVYYELKAGNYYSINESIDSAGANQTITLVNANYLIKTITGSRTVYFSEDLREQLNDYDYKEAYNALTNKEAIVLQIAGEDDSVNQVVLSGDTFIEGRYFASNDGSVFYDRSGKVISQSGMDLYLSGSSDANDNLNYEIYIAHDHNLAAVSDLFANLDDQSGDADLDYSLSTSNIHFVNGYGNVSLKTETLKQNPDLADWKAPLIISKATENAEESFKNNEFLKMDAAFVGELAILADDYVHANTGFTAVITTQYQQGTLVSPEKKLFEIRCDGIGGNKFSYNDSELTITSEIYGNFFVKDGAGNYSTFTSLKQGETVELYYKDKDSAYISAATIEYTCDLYLYDEEGKALNSTEIGTKGTGSYLIIKNANLGCLPTGSYTFTMTLKPDGTIAERNESDTSDQDNIYSVAISVIESPSNVVTTLDDIVDPYDGKTSLREAILADSVTSTVAGNRVTINGIDYDIADGKFYMAAIGNYYADPTTNAIVNIQSGSSFYLYQNAIVTTNTGVARVLSAGSKITYENDQFYYSVSGNLVPIILSNNTLLSLYANGIANGDYVIYFNHKNAEVTLKSGTVVDQIMDAYNSLWFNGNATFNQVQNGNFLVSLNPDGTENYLNLENIPGSDELWVRVSADEIQNNPGCVQKLNPSTGLWEDVTFGDEVTPEDLDLIWNWGDVWTVSVPGSDGILESVFYYRLVGEATVTAMSSLSGAVVAGQTYTSSNAKTEAFDKLVDGMILVDETTGAQFQYQEVSKDFLCKDSGSDTAFEEDKVYDKLSMTSSYKYEKVIETATEDKILSIVDADNFMRTEKGPKTVYFAYELADQLDDYDVTFDYGEINTKTGQINNEAILLNDDSGIFQKIDLVNNVTFEGRYFMEEVSVGVWKAVDASGNEITDLDAYKKAWNNGTESVNDKVDSVVYVYYPSFVDDVFSIAEGVSYSCQNVAFINGKGDAEQIINEADIYVTTIEDFVDLSGYYILNTTEDYVDYSYNYADSYKELTSADAANKLQITVLKDETIETTEGISVKLTKDAQLIWKGNGVWATNLANYKLADGTKIVYNGTSAVYTTLITDNETSLREAINKAVTGDFSSLESNKAVIKINRQAIPDFNPEFNLMLGALEIGYVKDVNVQITIDGTSANGGSFTIDAQHLNRAINITTSVTGYVPVVELIGLTIMNGKIADAEGSDVGGAAINSVGVVSITDCKIINNEGSFGGAVRNTGSMTITDSQITGNTGTAGTVYNSGDGSTLHCVSDGTFISGEISIYRTQISGNVSDNYGGAIFNTGKLYVADSVLTGNKAKNGGGIFVIKSKEIKTDVTVVNCTIAGNYAESTGGALWSDCEVTVQNSILIGNIAGTASSNDVFLKNGTNTGSFSSSSHNNLSSTDLGNGSKIYSVIDDVTGLIDYSELFVNFDALTALTWTVDKYASWDMNLVVAEENEFVNPAIDNGYDVSVTDPLRTTDMQGYNRIYNSKIDIGAYEYQPDVWAQFTQQPAEKVAIQVIENTKVITVTFTGSAYIPAETVIASIQTANTVKDTVQYTLLSNLDLFKIDENGNLLTNTIWSYSGSALPNLKIRVSGLNTESGYEDLEYSINMLQQSASSSIYKVNQINGSKVRINWQSVNGATGYRVRYKEVGSDSWVYNSSILTGTSGVITGAFVPGLTYAFQVQAVANGVLASDWSDAPVEDSDVSESAALSSTGSASRHGFSEKQCLTFGNDAPVLNSNIKSDFGVLGDQLVSLDMAVQINSMTTSISSWQINWGDGTPVDPIDSTAFTCKAFHFYQNNGDYTITVKIGDTAGYNKDYSFTIGTHKVSTASELVEIESESVAEVPAEENATEFESYTAQASAPVFTVNFSSSALLEMEFVPVTKLTPIGTLTEVVPDSEQVRSVDLAASLLAMEEESNDRNAMDLSWLDKETENVIVQSAVGSQKSSDKIFEEIFEDYLD